MDILNIWMGVYSIRLVIGIENDRTSSIYKDCIIFYSCVGSGYVGLSLLSFIIINYR
jgi:hypothetical protein